MVQRGKLVTFPSLGRSRREEEKLPGESVSVDAVIVGAGGDGAKGNKPFGLKMFDPLEAGRFE
jgi:hypothetical protein